MYQSEQQIYSAFSMDESQDKVHSIIYCDSFISYTLYLSNLIFSSMQI